MPTATATRSARPGTAVSKRLSLADISSKGAGLPNRYILHGLEKVGKTSFGTQTPKPVFLMTRGETGLQTLIDAGRVSEVPHFPECETWGELLSAIEVLTSEEHDYKTLVIDTLNGAERLCHEEVCRRDFNADWTDRGFMGYMRGYEVSLADWRQFLSGLDKLRELRKMAILGLCHTRVKTFKNPEGADFDRYQPELHEKTWGLTHKWADAIFFLNYEIFVNEADPKKKGKAVTSQARIMYTERHAAYDAGNRLGLAEEIEMGASPVEAWGNFCNALKQAGDK